MLRYSFHRATEINRSFKLPWNIIHRGAHTRIPPPPPPSPQCIRLLRVLSVVYKQIQLPTIANILPYENIRRLKRRDTRRPTSFQSSIWIFSRFFFPAPFLLRCFILPSSPPPLSSRKRIINARWNQPRRRKAARSLAYVCPSFRGGTGEPKRVSSRENRLVSRSLRGLVCKSPRETPSFTRFTARHFDMNARRERRRLSLALALARTSKIEQGERERESPSVASLEKWRF